jgi:hypothetical protein
MSVITRARTLLRLAPVAVAVAAVTTFGAAAFQGASTAAQASPVRLANLQHMNHAAMTDSDGPTLHTMVAPATGNVDASATISGATLAKRAGLALDPFSDPVSATDNPALIASAATAPTGTPHMSNLLTRHVAPSCVGTGSDGRRVQVVYAYESGRANDLAYKEATIRNEIANIDDVFALSSAKTGGGKRVRWAADTNCLPQIATAVVPAGSISNAGSTGTNAGAYWDALKANLANAGFGRADRKYLVFADAPAANPGICGLGDSYLDSRPTGNYNDYYAAQYGVVFQACFAASANDSTYAGHELVHTLGAVQGNAPNASQYGHCTDDAELMCYPDGSTTPMRQVCAATHEPLLDCNNDDYFSTNPATGSYLATNWNTANSSYLDTVPALAPAPALTVTAPASVTTGQQVTFTAAMTPAPATYEWLRNGVVIPGATGATYSITPKYYETGTLTLTARVTLDDGRRVSTSRSVAVTAAPAPTVALAGPATGTYGTDLTYTATATGLAPFTYAWTYPSANCQPKTATNGATLTLSCPTATGTLTASVGVTVTQADGRPVNTTKTTTISPAPMTVQIVGPDTLVLGQSATYTADVKNVPAGWSVSWNDSPASPTWIEQGYFTAPSTKITARSLTKITLEAFVYSSQTGQSMRLSRAIQGVPAPVTPTAAITGATSTPVAYSAPFRATLTGATATSYAWTSAQGWITGESTGPTVTLTPTTTGTDTLTAVITDTTGATYTAKVTVTATAAYAATLSVPTTLTPYQPGAISVTPNRSSTVRWSTDRTDCTVAAPTALSTTMTCTIQRLPVTVTATLTDTVTKQVITRTATSEVGPAVAPNGTGWSVTATGRHPVTLTGTLTNTTLKKPFAAALVTVQRAPHGSTVYTTVATLRTDANGRAVYAAPATAAATYRFVYAGAPTNAAATSTPVLVRIPTITALSAAQGYPTTFTGQTLNAATKKPLPAGTPVTLLVKWYGTSTWATVKTMPTDANGRVSYKWYPTRAGYFFLVHNASATTTGSGSATPFVRVPTRMSIGVRSGRPDVISGRLTTGAGVAMKSQYVTLQYRTYGTSTWRNVTRVVTNSTGSVAVKVQPKKRTYYRWVYGGTSTGYLSTISGSGYVSY